MAELEPSKLVMRVRFPSPALVRRLVPAAAAARSLVHRGAHVPRAPAANV